VCGFDFGQVRDLVRQIEDDNAAWEGWFVAEGMSVLMLGGWSSPARACGTSPLAGQAGTWNARGTPTGCYATRLLGHLLGQLRGGA
jgi:hypothetical protein